jgi:Na+/H+-dicarboxylate symporter
MKKVGFLRDIRSAMLTMKGTSSSNTTLRRIFLKLKIKSSRSITGVNSESKYNVSETSGLGNDEKLSELLDFDSDCSG